MGGLSNTLGVDCGCDVHDNVYTIEKKDIVMADQCSFCDKRRPAGGTNMLVLGPHWIEFCQPCGEAEKLTNSVTGKVMTIREIFESGEGRQSISLYGWMQYMGTLGSC